MWVIYGPGVVLSLLGFIWAWNFVGAPPPMKLRFASGSSWGAYYRFAQEYQDNLGPLGLDIEVLEMHHKHKVDAPSGTALLLGEAAARGRDVDLDEASVRVRDGHTGPRQEGTIGFATLRGGSVVGTHSVLLAGEGETITLSHEATDRSIFATGAVTAALWGRGRNPGFYNMKDILGLS